MKKNLAIGTSDFKDLRQKGLYFIDKSMIIKELIEDSSLISLIPRPRRFGKTLNMSMLAHFFNLNNAEENRKLFDGLKIENEPEFDAEQGKYPVIFISLKEVKGETLEFSIDKIRRLIGAEYLKFKFLLQSDELDEVDKSEFRDILNYKASRAQLEESLKRLCKNLYDHFKQKPLLLIDEYDTPIHTAFTKKYYDGMINFMSMFLGAALKDNEFLFKGVLTGTLRVSKESIFTGLNNLSVYSLLSSNLNDKFGFTEEEVAKMLSDFGLEYEIESVKHWYNGYIIGGLNIYNPWSIINFVHNYKDGFKPYWVNTSSNDMIKEIIKESPYSVQTEIKDLLDDKPLVKVLDENISFPELNNNDNAIYSFFVFSGYLKARLIEHSEEADFYELSIPNIEVKRLFKTIILTWFKETFRPEKSSMMLNALFDKDTELFGEILGECVLNSLSAFDVDKRNPERVYQAFLLGMLVSLAPEYEVTSNRESGYGRYDICIVPLKSKKPCIIMELKQIRISETAETALQSALKQIEDKQYEAAIRQRGYDDFVKLAVVFDGKRVWVKS